MSGRHRWREKSGHNYQAEALLEPIGIRLPLALRHPASDISDQALYLDLEYTKSVPAPNISHRISRADLRLARWCAFEAIVNSRRFSGQVTTWVHKIVERWSIVDPGSLPGIARMLPEPQDEVRRLSEIRSMVRGLLK